MIGDLTDNGTVFIYSFDGINWIEKQKLSIPIPANKIPGPDPTISFGYSVAIKGDLIAIGAPTETSLTNTDEVGAVYLYKLLNDIAVLDTKIYADTMTDSMFFTKSVAISNNTIMAGSRFEEDINNIQTGSVKVIESDLIYKNSFEVN